jgi:hypothetical protein
MNRFQYNFKRNVGAVSEEIRKCTPKNIEEWEKYYFKNVRTQEHIKELGEKLYTKIEENNYLLQVIALINQKGGVGNIQFAQLT